MSAPERIWARFTEDFGAVQIGQWADSIRIEPHGNPYILATPEALAKSPDVQALVMAERERCARISEWETKLPPQHNMKDAWRADIGTTIAAAIRAGTEGGE